MFVASFTDHVFVSTERELMAKVYTNYSNLIG